jgi:hypothetical protein
MYTLVFIHTVFLIATIKSHNLANAAALLIAAITILLTRSKYLSDALWSMKTILLDWIIGMVMMVILTCLDLILDRKYLGLLVSYFCAANIVGVALMKVCEALWRVKHGNNNPQLIEIHFVHNLKASVATLRSLGVNFLLYCCWIQVYIVYDKICNSGGIATWQVSFIIGLWSTLLVYLLPIAAQPIDTPQRQQS